MRAVEYLGRGWGFPVSPTGQGTLPVVEGADTVDRSIRIILATEPGERLMRPTFGCGLHAFVMKPNSVSVRAQIRSRVETALKTWEQRILLTEISVDPGDDPSLVLIRISYVHVRDRRPGNLVFPFYLE